MSLTETEIYYIEDNEEYKFINRYLDILKLDSNELKNFYKQIIEPNLEQLQQTLLGYQSTNQNRTAILQEIFGICKRTRIRFINFYIKNKELPNDEEKDNLLDNNWWDKQIYGLNIKKYNSNKNDYDEYNREYYSLKILLTLLKKRVNSHISTVRSKLNKFSHEELCTIGLWGRIKLWWSHGRRNSYNLYPFYKKYMNHNLKSLKNTIENLISQLDTCHNGDKDPESIASENAALLGHLDYLVYLCRKEINLAKDELNDESYLFFSTQINGKIESIKLALKLIPPPDTTPVATAVDEKK
jgi:hypothetical protein